VIYGFAPHHYDITSNRNDGVMMMMYDDDDDISSCDEEDVDNLSVDLGAGEQNIYCGSRRPPMMMSTSSRLQLTLGTGSSSSSTRGFAVNFAFITGSLCLLRTT